jgi:Holliday junction resolvase RusA-like endonuclease
MVARGISTKAKWLTDEQKSYRRDVILLTRSAMRGADALFGRLEMRLTLYFADRRRADISNRVKAIEDALTHANAYDDDSQIDRLIVERVVRSGNEECAVVLQEIGA